MELGEAVKHIQEGDVIGLPTETLYGLVADAFNEDAVKRIFRMKGRAPDKPLLVLISKQEMLQQLIAALPAEARPLMGAFWPGPLTIVFPKHPSVPDVVSKETIAIRMERHPIAKALIDQTGPVVAPSANKEGEEPPTTAAAVRAVFPDILVLDDGTTQGKASTIVSVVGTPTLVREGAITREELTRIIDI